jgi:glyoxylase-like metal-dependent hydrolase (beta-lactamase superfamily II)
MKIKTFSDGLLGSNGYLVWNGDGGRGMVIDCGNPVSAVTEFANENGITVDYILLTHGHVDHAEYTEDYQTEFPEAKLLCHEKELCVLRDSAANLTPWFGKAKSYPEPDVTLKNGDNVVIRGKSPENDIVFRVIDAPGHTPGGFLLLCDAENVMFTGDVLFHRGRGRTDFKGGDESAMRDTLRMIADMDGGIVFYSGHGEPSTVGAEKFWLWLSA